jgi:hypothetical protein
MLHGIQSAGDFSPWLSGARRKWISRRERAVQTAMMGPSRWGSRLGGSRRSSAHRIPMLPKRRVLARDEDQRVAAEARLLSSLKASPCDLPVPDWTVFGVELRSTICAALTPSQFVDQIFREAVRARMVRCEKRSLPTPPDGTNRGQPAVRSRARGHYATTPISTRNDLGVRTLTP